MYFLTQPLDNAIQIIHMYFIGKLEDSKELKRKEFFDRKCCSLRRKDLDRHFQAMIKLFYLLGADWNLKPIFLASIPKELSQAAKKTLQQRQKTITEATLGEIQQAVHIAIEELCLRREAFRSFLKENRHLDKACFKPGLKIKCPKDCSDPSCTGCKKKRHFKRLSFRKTRKGKGKDKCYVCNKKGHFAKNFPKASKRGSHLIDKIANSTGIQLDDSDIESVFSLDDQPSENTLCAIQTYSSDSDSENDVFTFFPDSPAEIELNEPVHHPYIPVHILLSKYHKPIHLVALIDTGASSSILDTKIIPDEFWKPYTRYFNSDSGDTFATKYRSKPITIQFFPRCSITTKILGSQSPDKDIIIGWDILTQLPKFRILSHGLRFKNQFKEFVDIKRFYVLQPAVLDPIIQNLLSSCAETHSQFSQTCTQPLWKNSSFYVKLPFKRNEDINPTKASHSGMSPEHLTLAQTSWHKVSLNPLIPNGHVKHFMSTIVPFGLKTAPSLFQKAMCKIFEPILSNSQIYIDDILLFSHDEQSHCQLLTHFADIVKNYGIILSQKKMIIAQKEIEFLGMCLKDGTYCPEPHIADELQKFPVKDLNPKQIQQFLGIVNYLRDFVPHISKYLRPLQRMLKKDPLPWGSKQTQAVAQLKQLLQNLPPLKIPSTGKRILQTDASDKYWAAILFEEIDGTRHICAYKSGRFSQAEIYYHSTFKEILAVKYGIKKFEFHLIGHHFLVEMDMSSFPQMLKFKQKQVPHPQLLRWAEWFSKYSFEVKHIPGTKNQDFQN
ncbi:hypothetical protein BT93_I0169 [Corymbia citriodora subsp. variegata]|nr:hypothetical protein BT93_I0169 [Corymbia citriodora subsp. variegata]